MTIKSANSPTSGSSGQKTQYGLMTLACGMSAFTEKAA
jgi:hypothetical protein